MIIREKEWINPDDEWNKLELINNLVAAISICRELANKFRYKLLQAMFILNVVKYVSRIIDCEVEMPSKTIFEMLTKLLAIIAVSFMFAATSFAGTTTYIYDELDRLNEVHFDNGNGIKYEYDEIGNLKSKTPTGNVFSIAASAGNGGSIFPTGTVVITAGSSKSYSIVPLFGFRIIDVLVDGVSQGAISNFTFADLAASHTIAATFATNKTYTFTVTASAGGTIAPGSATIYQGESQTFTVTSAMNYHIADVLIDGASVGAVTAYTFPSVTANHSISATFAINTYTITTSAGSNGSISPSSPTVNYGSSASFNITPATGYHVTDVVVDGVSQGAISSYTFSNVTADHTISATFAINMYPITVIQGIGEFTPASAMVAHGSSQTFNISHTSRYQAVAVKVDGVSQGTPSSYTFTNVTGPHTIEAVFSLIPCSNPPARIAGTESYFVTLQAAYDAAADGAIIQTQGQLFTENFTGNRNISVTIDGGYTCEYTANPDYTMLQGAQSITTGAVKMINFRVKQ